MIGNSKLRFQALNSTQSRKGSEVQHVHHSHVCTTLTDKHGKIGHLWYIDLSQFVLPLKSDFFRSRQTVCLKIQSRCPGLEGPNLGMDARENL